MSTPIWPDGVRGGDRVIVQHRKTKGGPLYTDAGTIRGFTVTADGRTRMMIGVDYDVRPRTMRDRVQIKQELTDFLYVAPESIYRPFFRYLTGSRRWKREAHRTLSALLRTLAKRRGIPTTKRSSPYGPVTIVDRSWDELMRDLAAADAKISSEQPER